MVERKQAKVILFIQLIIINHLHISIYIPIHCCLCALRTQILFFISWFEREKEEEKEKQWVNINHRGWARRWNSLFASKTTYWTFNNYRFRIFQLFEQKKNASSCCCCCCFCYRIFINLKGKLFFKLFRSFNAERHFIKLFESERKRNFLIIKHYCRYIISSL